MKGVLKFTVWVGAVLLIFAYLFWRTDIVPEAVSPLIGYIDDSVFTLIVLFLTTRLLKRMGLDKQ
jgi:uncharacterized membrane protein YkvA (DUF1232 family)